LQAPLLELQEKLNFELERNPIIEQEKNPLEELAGDPMGTVASAEDPMDTKHDNDDADISDILKLADSWHDSLPPGHSREYYTSEDAEKREFMFSSLVEQPSLQEQLLEQLRLTNIDDKTAKIAEIIIGSIDESGYLRTHTADIAMASNASMNNVEKALQLVQSFEPAGIGARDLRECLLLQLERKEIKNGNLYKLIDKHLEEIGKNHLPQIAKKLNLSINDLNLLIAQIKTLNPFPGSALAPSQPVFVIPELSIEKQNDGEEFVIQSNDSYMPRLRISKTYLDLLEDPLTPPETKSYIREKLVAAKLLMKSLEQRQSTIKRIAQVIIDSQHDFLAKGIEYMRPLTMLQVADKLGLHETTISRAIANKHLQTPYGLFEFKYFFSGGYQTDDGEELSSRSIKEKLRDLILGEDAAKPLSDNKLSTLLKKDGLNVARRTVAKYREDMGIQPSNLRKEFK
ncbi:MAG: RNA polymerase factor sigma-54, partial [Victivallaceae bacterium]